MKSIKPSAMALLTTKQVADLLGIKPHTLEVNRAYGGNLNIPNIKLGRLVRYSLADVEAFIERLPRRDY